MAGDLGARWRKAAAERWSSRIDVDSPDVALEMAADAAVDVVLKELQAIAASDGNMDDRLWHARFAGIRRLNRPG